MTGFVKYLSSAHLNGKNIAMYSADNGIQLRAEHIAEGKVLGIREFDTDDQAVCWFDGVCGTGLSKLANALERLIMPMEGV